MVPVAFRYPGRKTSTGIRRPGGVRGLARASEECLAILRAGVDSVRGLPLQQQFLWRQHRGQGRSMFGVGKLLSFG